MELSSVHGPSFVCCYLLNYQYFALINLKFYQFLPPSNSP